MTEPIKAELLSFANKLHYTAELLETTANRTYGRKAVSQQARVSLNEIKRNITHVKRLTMDTKKERTNK